MLYLNTEPHLLQISHALSSPRPPRPNSSQHPPLSLLLLFLQSQLLKLLFYVSWRPIGIARVLEAPHAALGTQLLVPEGLGVVDQGIVAIVVDFEGAFVVPLQNVIVGQLLLLSF